MKNFSRDYIGRSLGNFKISIRRVIQDLESARWAIIFIIAYFVVLRKVLYTICPMMLVTGYPCPACGMTRAGVLFLQFKFKEAFEIQPFIFWFVFCAAIFCMYRYVLLRKCPEWLKWVTCVGLVGMIVFYIYRMVVYFPGDAPMTYYSGNMINRIISMIKLWRP